jgi:hypothetical protein
MLDECKGDKLMELLLVFSTAVLKRTMGLRTKQATKTVPIAKSLATASLLSSNQQNSLLPLAIAHRANLQNVLKRKEVQRSRYVAFSRLLDTKSTEINQRIETCQREQQMSGVISRKVDTVSVKRQLRDNWSGDAKWLDTMLHGDEEKSDDVFLQKPFKDIWPRVENCGTLKGEGKHEGLLESLEARVQEHRSRIDRWQAFHDEINKSRQTSSSVKEVPPSKENAKPACAFDAHVELQIGDSKTGSAHIAKDIRTSQTYQDIVSEMKDDLSTASRLRRDRTAASRPRERRDSSVSSKSPARGRPSRSDSFSMKAVEAAVEAKPTTKPAPRPAPRRQTSDKVSALARKYDASSTPIDSEATLIGSTKESIRSRSPVQLRTSLPKPQSNEREEIPRKSAPPIPIETPLLLRSPSPELLPTSTDLRKSDPLEFLTSKEDQLAAQIISSIGEATPSPTKKSPRVSLTERARMSMAHASFKPSESIEESPPPISSTAPVSSIPTARASLAERTRQSMSRVSLAPQHKRKSLAVITRRQSVFPVNQFETPRKQAAIEEERDGSATPKEFLFSEKAEYENVFKSRPKIAVSPVLSPEDADLGLEGEEEGGLPVDKADSMVDWAMGVDLESEDSVLVEHWESSPLRRPGIRERNRV